MVIVGAGGAGLAVAASASEAGTKVVVLEKMSFTGGNTLLGEGTYNEAAPVRQALLPMTEDIKAEVEAAPALETNGNEELEALISGTRKDYEDYLASCSTTLFDSASWHALQTYAGSGCIADISLIREYAEEAVTVFDLLENEIGV